MSPPNSHDSNALPLTGVRVADFSHLMPGPWASQVLGDLGADVIKIERKGAPDASRFNAPYYSVDTVYFHSANRNKRSIALDLRDGGDAAVAQDIVRRADILIESFRPGVTRRLGIDYDHVQKVNPAIIYCSITGFGGEGPLASTPGHDAALQALAGVLDVPNSRVTPPMPRIQTADWGASSFAVMGVLAAYIRRQATGRGANIDVPIYDSVLVWASNKLSSALARIAGHSGEPTLESFGTNPRYSTYRTKDDKAVIVALLETRSWVHFCNSIGRPDLIFREETPEDRHKSHPVWSPIFRKALEEFCGGHDRDELVARMEQQGIAIGPVLTPDEAVALADANGKLAYLQHPKEGRVPFFIDPLARCGLADPHGRPPPAVDEHGAAIREELASNTGLWGGARPKVRHG